MSRQDPGQDRFTPLPTRLLWAVLAYVVLVVVATLVEISRAPKPLSLPPTLELLSAPQPRVRVDVTLTTAPPRSRQVLLSPEIGATEMLQDIK